MKADLFWIPGPWSGRLAIVARPRGGDWLVDEVSSWRTDGVDTVVSLIEDAEAQQLDVVHEPQAAEAYGMRFISFPIPDRGVPASVDAAISLIGRIARHLERGSTVAVHCRQGIGRSGLIAAGVVMTSGVGAQEAIQIVSAARGIGIPETPEQRGWLEQLPVHLPVTNSRAD
jgi:protein-tyrosine phosphatase